MRTRRKRAIYKALVKRLLSEKRRGVVCNRDCKNCVWEGDYCTLRVTREAEGRRYIF